MGLCLDTGRSNDSIEDDDNDSWFHNSPNNPKTMNSLPENQLDHNSSNLNYEMPKVPVIFVLGGPGSGKVTHCDNFAQENEDVVHINMTDLLQQYTIGNDMQDFCQLSSLAVTEVLMLEMKMAPNSKAFLVSGYPRNMRDVVEYSDKIKTLTGVILIVWREKVLERHVQYGAKLGQVVMSLARMELSNFFRNVIPVADYFSHSNLLLTVNGEKQPDEVYEDFKTCVLQSLDKQANQTDISNDENLQRETPTTKVDGVSKMNGDVPSKMSVANNIPLTFENSFNSTNTEWPMVLWIIGGPGSNKASLCDQAAKETGWAHISLGRLLRSTADLVKNSEEAKTIKECLVAGELVSDDLILKIVQSQMTAMRYAPGIFLDGFPRTMNQVVEFEKKFKQKPTLILLDCSKLQLGRGRIDDTVTAFRKKLEVFRQYSLPMLRSLDNVGRLTIVDGDTDATSVREDFQNVVKQNVEYYQLESSNSRNIIDSNTTNNNNNNHVFLNGDLPRYNNKTSERIMDSLKSVDDTHSKIQNQHKLNNAKIYQ